MKNIKWIGLILALLLAVGIFPMTAVPAFADGSSLPPPTITIPTMWCGSTYGPHGIINYPVTISGASVYDLRYTTLLEKKEDGYLGYDVLSYNRTYNGGNAAFIEISLYYPNYISFQPSEIPVINGSIVAYDYNDDNPNDDLTGLTIVLQTKVKHIPGEAVNPDEPAGTTQPVYCAVCGRTFSGKPGAPASLFTLSVPTLLGGTEYRGYTGPDPSGAPVSLSGDGYELYESAFVYPYANPSVPSGYYYQMYSFSTGCGGELYIKVIVTGPSAPRAKCDFTVKGASLITFQVMNTPSNQPTRTEIILGTKAKHDYGSWEIVQEPTATEPGSRQRICNYCGHVQTQELLPFGITKQPAKVTAEAGGTASFSVTATGTDLTYQWQYSKDNGSTWIDCKSAGHDSDTFSFTATASMNGRLYRCKVADAYNSEISNSAKLTVSAGKPEITTQPKAQSVTANKTAKFSVTATGSNLTYQWQYSKDGGSTWTDCTSANHDKATFSFTAKASMSGRFYRCKVSNSAGSVTSAKAKLTVAGAKPEITAQPKAQSVTANNTAKFSITATGSGLTYQWQYSKDNGSTWIDCTSANHDKATFSFTAKSGMNGRLYRCVVTNASGKATSSTAKLTVK